MSCDPSLYVGYWLENLILYTPTLYFLMNSIFKLKLILLQSFLAEPVSIQGRSNLDNIEMAYARQVCLYQALLNICKYM
jgi:hypothetical protein